jgi:hypothetical protein
VSLAGASVPAGGTIDVPVVAGDLTGLGVLSYRIFVAYDPAALEYVSNVPCAGGVVFTGSTIQVIGPQGPEIHASGASSQPFAGAGCLFAMRFRMKSSVPPGGTSALRIVRAEFLPERPCARYDGNVGCTAAAAVEMTPPTGASTIGTSHTWTATVVQNGAPRSGASVSFAVLAGPHAGTTGVGTTNALGQATFTYWGAVHGTDYIRCTVPVQAGIATPLLSCVAARFWSAGPTDATPGDIHHPRIEIHPNPVLDRTTIRYAGRNDNATIAIFDLRGRLVRRLSPARDSEDRWMAAWDGRDEAGRDLADGLYLVRVGPRGPAGKILLQHRAP